MSDSADVIESVGHVKDLVHWMVHHCRGEVVKTEHVSHFMCLWILGREREGGRDGGRR